MLCSSSKKVYLAMEEDLSMKNVLQVIKKLETVGDEPPTDRGAELESIQLGLCVGLDILFL